LGEGCPPKYAAALNLDSGGQACFKDPRYPTIPPDVRASLREASETEASPTPTPLPTGVACPYLSTERPSQCVAATRKNWWYEWVYSSCNLIFYSKFQVVAGINPKSDNGKFNHQYKLLGEKSRGNWGYKINAEKNSSKYIKEECQLYRSILGKYRYTSLELAVRRWGELCIRGLLWARLPCSIGIGDK